MRYTNSYGIEVDMIIMPDGHIGERAVTEPVSWRQNNARNEIIKMNQELNGYSKRKVQTIG